MKHAKVEPNALCKVSRSSLKMGIEAYDKIALFSSSIDVHETRTDSVILQSDSKAFRSPVCPCRTIEATACQPLAYYQTDLGHMPPKLFRDY
jgi:hypothetical protein